MNYLNSLFEKRYGLSVFNAQWKDIPQRWSDL